MTAGAISFARGEDPLRADKLNAAFVERLLVAGDAMLGPLILVRDPQVPFEAVTKQYTDALVTSKLTGFLSTTGGTMYGPLFLFRDPQTAMEASTRQYTDAKAASVAAAYLPLTGGTLLGNLTLAGDAVTQLQPVTLRQLSTLGSTASIAVGDTPPTPGLNKLWWDSVACQLYIWFDDGTSSQWVPAMAVPASIGEAPSNGSVYARQSGQWTDIGTASLSKNLLHNSMFNIAQRGAGPFTSNVYALDRWALSFGNGSSSVTPAAVTDASRALIGDEAAQTAFSNVVVGSATVGSYNLVYQPIENVYRLAGKTVTVSFWAAVLAGTLKLGISLDQNFGTGGSPSATVNGAGTTVTLSTTWTRYQVTLTLPSVTGKSLGSNNNHFTALNFWCSAEATFAARSGSVGVQSGSFLLWGVQLEIGNTATALEKIDPQQDLAKCQRFYQIGSAQQSIGGNSWVATWTNTHWAQFPVPMRTTPTMTNSVASQTNCSGSAFTAQSATVWQHAYAISAATGGVASLGTWTATADL